MSLTRAEWEDIKVLPAPVIVEHEGFLVVRDDLLPGGTKRRALHVLFDEQEEYVYASPVYGYAQIALALTARDYGKRATIFCAKRLVKHQRTREAEAAGATIVEIPNGYLNVVRARAREYCSSTGAKLLPFGLDDPTFIDALTAVARALPILPAEVWSVCGSGVLIQALQQAWPTAIFYGVRVGAKPIIGHAHLYRALEEFEQPARLRPPFPSVDNYDAKAWSFVKQNATPGALFWNVAG